MTGSLMIGSDVGVCSRAAGKVDRGGGAYSMPGFGMQPDVLLARLTHVEEWKCQSNTRGKSTTGRACEGWSARENKYRRCRRRRNEGEEERIWGKSKKKEGVFAK